VDAEGYFTYVGRSDDLLKVGAVWVAPVEVEAALLAHPDVAEAAVVGGRDEHGLEKPKAFVVLRDGRPGTDEMVGRLQTFVKERLAPYKYPRWVEFVPELPKTATGKIQRYKLRSV
jgi:acyl-coenzyme A synthetase/AMP-(fatty) acid ligase